MKAIERQADARRAGEEQQGERDGYIEIYIGLYRGEREVRLRSLVYRIKGKKR